MFGQFRLRRPSPGTVLGGLALIVATSGVAVAAIPGGDKAVTVCIAKDGSIKAVDAEAGKTCQGSQATAKLATTDSTGKVANADLLDGQDSAAFLGAAAKAADADKLDAKDSSDFLGATAKAADSDKLDGKDSSAFAPGNGQLAYLASNAFMLDFKPASSYQDVVAKGEFARMLPPVAAGQCLGFDGVSPASGMAVVSFANLDVPGPGEPEETLMLEARGTRPQFGGGHNFRWKVCNVGNEIVPPRVVRVDWAVLREEPLLPTNHNETLVRDEL